MRLKNLIPLLVAFTLLLPGLAFANPAGEQLILREINVGSFEVWKHTNGQWQDTDHDGTVDVYGQTNKKTRPLLYFMPRSQYTDGFEFTRAVVRHTVTEQDYNDSKTMERPDKGESWDSFFWGYLKFQPNNYSITYTASEKGTEQPVVSVTRILDLMPKSLNLKDPVVRQKLGRDERQFADLAEGWLWYTPITIEWYGIPKEQKFNLVASSINSGAPGKAKPNQKYTGTVTFKYFGDKPITNVPIGVFNGNWPAILKNSSGTAVTTDNFNPGDVKTYTFEWTAPKDGIVTLTGAISISPPLSSDPHPKETTKEDNKNSISIMVEEPLSPPEIQTGPGSLKLTSISQDRKITRPAGTTKWTDWITADFTAPKAPDLGRCYNLIKWELESVKIEYPKVHPEFTFGSPYEPSGTVTKNMNVNSKNNTAKIEFKEDWSLNGAPIYDMLRKQHIPGPTKYPIKATYKINWEYELGELDCCGEDECSPCCVNYKKYKKTETGTVKAEILVNGTGVNSLAQ